MVGPGRDVRIRPGPGSLFRILGPFRAEEPWRVEVAGGKVDVEGAAQAFAAGRVRVSPGAGASSLSVGILVPGGGGEGPPAPVDSDPTITVGRGVAELRLLLSGEVLRLAAGEAATVVPGWREERRLAPLGAWEDRDAGTVLLGCPLLDAFPGPGDSLRVVLAPRDGTVRALEIPGDRVAEAVGSLNAAMSILVRRIEAAPGPGPGDLGPRREYRHEREGRVTRILAGGGGPAVLDAAGAFDVFPRLADLRRRRPDAAALFGGLLP